MAIITRKIGNKEYAYLILREGEKVIHKYLGSLKNPQVTRLMDTQKESSSIPARLHSLFWDTSLEKIHMKRNARYIIERLLEFGDMYALEWLQRVYPTRTIIDVIFLSRNITDKSRNFWMLWFGVADA
ncbi:MAG: hypothetical protein L6290_10605 [Thermodesulfovibrionales bacterium]|nr:hypothetical protein [Thermodesulfovibrionales bacterium]